MVDVNDYIRKKYNLDAYGDDQRNQLVQQNADAASPLLAGLSAFGAGIAGRDVGQAFKQATDYQQAPTLQALQAFDKNRANAMDAFKFDQDVTKAGREDRNDMAAQDKVQREADPTSQESALARDLAAKMVPGRSFDGMNAQQINGLIPSLTKIYETQQKSLDRQAAQQEKAVASQQRFEDNKLRREELSSKQDERINMRREQNDDRDTQKLADKLGNAQEMLSALGNVESKLGFPLDGATAKDGKLLVQGKEKDLPGVSIPGYGRATFGQEDALDLESAVARVFNTVLKDRSGAAVTNQEMDRLQKEFGRGKWNTEAQLVKGLQDYKKSVAAELKNREAGFKPDIIETYQKRGGVTSANLGGVPSSMNAAAASNVRVRDPNGVVRLVPAQSVKDAVAAGGTLLDRELVDGGR